MRMFSRPRRAGPAVAALTLAILIGFIDALVGAPAAIAAEATDLSLEDLLKTEVTTASRKSQALFDVPAAAFVLSADDIARSGARQLPELLRLVPGVEVAQLAAGQWAVTARGSNGRFAQKLLVLVDGRSIYSSLFSGVLWETTDMVIEDIERIEVIRGPGAALWGANAVNGVINVITKRSDQTQGALAAVNAGNAAIVDGSARYGFRLGDDLHGRIWAKRSGDASAHTIDDDTAGRRTSKQVGAQIDSREAGRVSTVAVRTLEATTSAEYRLVQLTPPYASITTTEQTIRNTDLLLRTQRALDERSELTLQATILRETIDLPFIGTAVTTTDLDASHRIRWAADQELVWGAALRHKRDETRGALPTEFRSPTETANRSSLYFQNDWDVAPGSLRASLGTRFEHLTGTESEFQPNLRLLWLPRQGHTVWAAASRAARLPSRAERDIIFTYDVLPPDPAAGSPLPIQILADPGARSPLESEHLAAWELGYRGEVGQALFVDVTAFSNRLSNLRYGSTSRTTSFANDPPRVVVAAYANNAASATVRGLEFFAEYRPHGSWRWQFGGNLQSVNESPDDPTNPVGVAGNSPRHQFFTRLSFDPWSGQSVDLIVKRVGQLDLGPIPGYTRVDARYAVRFDKALEVALSVQNLAQAAHREFQPDYLPSLPVEVRRTVYLQLRASW